jgi:hypothetical protein
LLAIVPAVAAKVAVVLPFPTVTETGTANAAALLDSATVAPAAGAAVFSETVQAEDPPVLSDAGAQLRALRVGGGGAAAVTVPPTPVSDSELSRAFTPNVLATLMVVRATPDGIVTLTTATTPLCITVVFKPVSRQRYEPEPAEQESDLPAALVLGPAIALIEETPVGGYVKVH